MKDDVSELREGKCRLWWGMRKSFFEWIEWYGWDWEGVFWKNILLIWFGLKFRVFCFVSLGVGYFWLGSDWRIVVMRKCCVEFVFFLELFIFMDFLCYRFWWDVFFFRFVVFWFVCELFLSCEFCFWCVEVVLEVI